MGDHPLARGSAPTDAKAHPGVQGQLSLTRHRRRRAMRVIASVAIGVICGSMVLPPPLPRAWANHDPAAIWGLVAESHDVESRAAVRAKIREQKRRRAAKKTGHGKLTRKNSIPTPKKGPEPLTGNVRVQVAGTFPVSDASVQGAESPALLVAGAPPAETDKLRAGPPVLVAHEAIQVQVTMGTSLIVDLPGQLQRASVTNPEVANIQIVPPNQILVNGKAPGITTLIAWTDGKRRYYDVVVTSNLSLLQQAMKEISPRDEIGVKAVQTSVVLSGTVSNPSLIAKAAGVAKAFLPDKAAVVNLLQLGEPHQIMLRVEVAEVNRKALRELGLDFVHLGSSFVLAFFTGGNAGLLSTIFDQSNNSVSTDQRGSVFVRSGNTRAILRALEEKGLVKSLARPNLIAASGASASFLVGGEFPIPVPGGGGTGTVTIQFKPFGVRLDFTPTLNDLGSINLKISPEVSDLDFENGLDSGGFRIPALRTRRASTIVDLRPGQGLAIGGLLLSDDRKSLSKIPVLGDIPVLGALFRSTSFTRNETDLIIFVTPEIVKPLESGKAPNLEEQMTPTPEEEKEIRQILGK